MEPRLATGAGSTSTPTSVQPPTATPADDGRRLCGQLIRLSLRPSSTLIPVVISSLQRSVTMSLAYFMLPTSVSIIPSPPQTCFCPLSLLLRKCMPYTTYGSRSRRHGVCAQHVEILHPSSRHPKVGHVNRPIPTPSIICYKPESVCESIELPLSFPRQLPVAGSDEPNGRDGDVRVPIPR